MQLKLQELNIAISLKLCSKTGNAFSWPPQYLCMLNNSHGIKKIPPNQI